MNGPVVANANENPDRGVGIVSPQVTASEIDIGAWIIAIVTPTDGAASILCSGDGTVWRLPAGAPAGAVTKIADLGAVPLAAAPDLDAGRVLVGSDDGRAVSIGLDGAIDTITTIDGAWVEQIATHAETSRRAIACGREIRVFDADGTVVAWLAGHPSTVAGIAFSPDGGRLAAVHYGGVSVWSFDALADQPERLAWHGSHTRVTWSPDGRYIVSAMQDREMHAGACPRRKACA